MAEDNKVDPYYVRQARQMVDALIVAGIINSGACTDEAKDSVAEYLGWELQRSAEHAIRMTDLSRKYAHLNKKDKS